MGEIKELIISKKPICKKCGSNKIIKIGNSYNKYSIKQKYKCKDCSHKFVAEDDFKRMKTPRNIIRFALRKYKDYSARDLSKLIKTKFRYNISHATISRWIEDKDGSFYMSPTKRFEQLKENLKPFRGKLVKAAVIRNAGDYSKSTSIARCSRNLQDLIKPAGGHGFYIIKKFH